MTWQQSERQASRDGGGRYNKLNPCECCGRGAGANYYSDERCNATGYGLVLCKRCCAKLAKLDDAGFLMQLGVDPTPERLAKLAALHPAPETNKDAGNEVSDNG